MFSLEDGVLGNRGSPLVILALLLMKAAPELSPQWFTGLVIALLLGVAYVADEIA